MGMRDRARCTSFDAADPVDMMGKVYFRKGK
jgi:hypothetical protein